MSDPTLAVQNLPIVVHAQYVKDLSFENPNAPGSLRGGAGAPEMDVSVNLSVRNIESDNAKAMFEVVTQLRVRALRGENAMFLVDLDYAMVVSIDGVPDDHRHPVLLIEVPKLSFPFVRQILAGVVSDGGFPPLYLTPVDFGALYMERYGKKD